MIFDSFVTCVTKMFFTENISQKSSSMIFPLFPMLIKILCEFWKIKNIVEQ